MKRLVAFILTTAVTLALIIGTVPTILDSVKLGLDLKGGFEILYEASPLEEGQQVTREALVVTAKNLQKRADVVGGVGEPEIYPEGENRIRVRIAGVDNIDEVRQRMKDPAGARPSAAMKAAAKRSPSVRSNFAVRTLWKDQQPWVMTSCADPSSISNS